jgi:sec-independent protein translocase protein TatB
MDSFFGIGPLELLVVLLLAGILLGPQRIRHVAKWLGKMTAQLQGVARTFSRQLNSELDALDSGGDLRGTMEEVKELRRQLDSLRREVTSVAAQPYREAADVARAAQESTAEPKPVENKIQPPGQLPPPLPRPLNVADDPDT